MQLIEAINSPLEEEFISNLKQFKDETKLLSDLSLIIGNKHYIRIINQGRNVVPLVMEEYRRNGGFWHHALFQLTGINPVDPNHIGKVDLIRSDWINYFKHK